MTFVYSRPWYHKNLSRLEAEERLLKTDVQGAYLVRESESLAGIRVLSVLTQSEVRHFKIVTSPDGKISLEAVQGVQKHYFESIDHLLNYYQVERNTREFPTALSTPVVKDGSLTSDDKDDVDSDFEDDVDDEENISKFFKLQFDVLKGKCGDKAFEEVVESYIGNGLKQDLKKIESGVTRPPHFQKLLASAAGELQKSLELFTKKILFLQDLFDVGENKHVLANQATSGQKSTPSSSSRRIQQCPTNFDGILESLSTTKSQMLSLEREAYRVLKDYSGTSNQTTTMPEESYEVIPTTRVRSQTESRHKQGICQFFQVYKGNKKKHCISVNMKDGKVSFLKNTEEAQDASNTYNHGQISQLLKDKSSKTSLGIAIDEKVTTYTFQDFQSRELFCQLIEHMKNVHSNVSQTYLNQLSVFAGTWNMANSQPPDDISSWLRGNGHGKLKDLDVDNPYDIVAIGTQESGLNEKEWMAKLKAVLKKTFNVDYKLVAKWSLWDIRLVILVRPLHISRVSYVKQSVVKTGIANALGNKGAVGISFFLGSTSFCFVNCHLSARQARVLKRNQNYHDILRGLNLGKEDVFDISCQFHHLFWLGDINYRIHTLEIEEIIKMISKNELQALRKYDQLKTEKERGNAFYGFDEEALSFRPTYRYKIGSNNVYIWIKPKTGRENLINVPSWCDRVLWKSFPEMFIANTSYGATEDILTSDHAPVFATFDVGIISQYVDPDCHTMTGPHENVKIEFLHITAKVRTSCKTKFLVTFHSTCLEGKVTSKVNSINDWRSIKKEELSYSFPGWTEHDLPKLNPALSSEKYLEDQHILLAVKEDDGHESYGECVLSVKRLMRSNTEEFVCCLTHLGDESGEIRGKVRMDMPNIKHCKSVIKAVTDLKKVPGLDQDGFRQSLNMENHTPQNYELVGSFVEENTGEPGAPKLPPKKRLSKAFSNPATPSSPSADVTSDIIWIGNAAGSPEGDFSQRFSMASKDLPPPPVPRRIKEPMTSSPRRSPAPVPKPRSIKSITRSLPQSFEEWLQRIDCLQYCNQLRENGWDDLGFLNFENDDLMDAGIENAEHREIILKSAHVINSEREKLSRS